MTDSQEQWQLAGSAPELYERYLVPAMTSLWAADLVDRAALEPGERVLDEACGTGVVARAAAARVGASGRVIGLDVNPRMLDVARSTSNATDAAIEWQEGTALALPFPSAAFDVVLCQLGLQFFPDRLAALREMLRVLEPDGRMALNVFGPIERNPATQALADALDRQIDPDASLAKRTEHALADPVELRALVESAGFQDVHIVTATKTVRFSSPAEYVRIQLSATPLATVLAGQGQADDLTDALIADVTKQLARYTKDGGLIVPQEVQILQAAA